MNRKFVKGLCAGLFLAFIASTFLFWLMVRDRKLNIPYGQNVMDVKMDVLQQYIDDYYLDDYEMEDLYQSAYAGYVAGLGDRYSSYTSPKEAEAFKEKTVDNVGIGVYVQMDDKRKYPFVTEVIKNSAAYKAGIETGDYIIKVDDEDIHGLTLTDVTSRTKGESGTTVKITVEREKDEILDFNITRNKFDSSSVYGVMFRDNIGYILVTSFSEKTSDQFNAAVDVLIEQGMEALIIDLRDNGGGYVNVAVNICDRILPADKIVTYTIDKKDQKEEMTTEDEEEITVPIALLVNGGSASASEIVSGCLRAYDKAALIGEKTYGKGIVQTTFSMGDGSAIKLTTAKYYTPDDQNIHGVGFEPDIEAVDDTATENDEVIDAALDYLNKAK